MTTPTQISTEVLDRLQLIEERLYELMAMMNKSELNQPEWIDSKALCAAVGIKNKVSLHHYMSKGVFKPDAIRNVGTPLRPRYRFHRRKAVDQFLNRVKG